MAPLYVAAARQTSRKSRSTRASPSLAALREHGCRARAAQRASAPLAAGQAARHPGLMWCRNNVGTLGASACLREVQGRHAFFRPSVFCRPSVRLAPAVRDRPGASHGFFAQTPPWTMPPLGAMKI